MDNVEKREELQSKCLKTGLAALLVSVIFGLFWRQQFFQSYLMAYVFWLGLAGGGLAFLMIQHLVAGRWILVTRRILEAAARTMPLMLLLFIPIVIGMGRLYEWTNADLVAHDEMLQSKAVYLNKTAFLVRAGLYFAIWIVMSRLLTAWSRRQDETGEPGLALKMRKLSGIGLVIYGLTGTFAAFDWMMSLEPHWFSTIYGALFVVGQGLSALALTSVVLYRISHCGPLKGLVGPQQYHDVGNLMFAFVILWTYMGFGQFLIIWSGNLHEETFWYLDRRYGGWLWVSVFLAIGNFLIPFLLLLMKRNKRRPEVLSKIAIWILLTRFVDIFWHIAPTFHETFSVSLLDITLPIGIGGVWLFVFMKHLEGAPLVPAKDPNFEKFFGGQEAASH